jgi:oligopeptidase B
MNFKAWKCGWLAIGVVLALAWTSPSWADQPIPPRADIKPRDVSVHGDRRIDNYFWLRERSNPAVMEYLKAEAAYTAQWFERVRGLTQLLNEEMRARIPQAEVSEPVRQGLWWYSTVTSEGQQYPVHVRQASQGPSHALDVNAPQQVLLDLNELARGHKFLSVPLVRISPDASRLVYGVDHTGALDVALKVRDVSSGQNLPWSAPKTDGQAVWAADSRTLFFVTTNAAKRSHRLWRQRVDAAGTRPVLVFEERDPLFNLQLGHTADGRFLVLNSVAKDRNELRILPSDRPEARWRRLVARQAGLELQLEHQAGRFLILSTDRGPQFRLLTVPVERLPRSLQDLSSAEELIPHRDDAMLEGLTVFDSHVAVQVRSGGSVGQHLLPVAGGAPLTVDFGLTGNFTAVAGSAMAPNQAWLNRDPGNAYLRVHLQSQTQPQATVDVNLATGLPTVRRVRSVPGYDASRYATERLWAKAAEGTLIPISLVYAKSKRTSGPQALLLKGYGAYGVPSDPQFSSVELSLLDRGVLLAIAHVRGGGDLGRTWYHAGKLSRKMNSFTDFVAVAEHLVAKGYTQPAQLAASGGSAGGLLMGGVVNLRPDLFRAVIAEVPFVDVINTMLDETIPLTTEEFVEWGNPKIKTQYGWIRAYSPYDNLKPGAYPAMLLTTGWNDSQVPYWEAAKYVAKQRTLKTDARPLLFDIDLDVGHGGASGRFDALLGHAKMTAFLLHELGLEPQPPRSQ